MTQVSARSPDDEAAYRRALELNPRDAAAWYKLGYLLANDPARAGEAETAYRKAIELEPNSARYVYRLALLLHEQLHRPAHAEQAYRQAIALAPDDPFYYSGFVTLLVEQSRRSEALTLAAQMRALLNAAEFWYGLAVLDAILGNADAAIDHLAKAAETNGLDRAWARIDPDLTSIRADPRFEAIVGRG
jgi:tetratricopeptide (TPR) repeat protein